MRSKAFAVGLCLLGFAATVFAQQQLAFDVLKAYPGTAQSAPLTLHRQVE